jgi:hypothetical protein
MRDRSQRYHQPVRAIIFSAATGPIFCIATLVAHPVASLSPKDVADAIQLGNFGEPRPYVLHGRSVDPGRRNAFELAAVYTPFVRVALAARAARDSGHVLTPEDLDGRLLEPLAYIAFRWVAGDATRPDSDYGLPQVYCFGRDIAWSGLPMPRNGKDPTWVKREGEATALLASFGADRPYDDLALVAAYPIEMLPTDGRYVIFRKLLASPSLGAIVSEGEILPDELARWR